MKNLSALILIITFFAACTKSNNNPTESPGSPTAKQNTTTEEKKVEKFYKTEMSNSTLIITFGDSVVSKIEEGNLIGTSHRFVAYQIGDSNVLMGKDGAKIYSCSPSCVIKVTNSFASVQVSSAEGIIFNSLSEQLYSVHNSEENIFRISDSYASVSSPLNSVLYMVERNELIHSCSDVTCDIQVSNAFASINSGIRGATLYHKTRGRIFDSTSPVSINITDETAMIMDSSGSSYNYNQTGEKF